MEIFQTIWTALTTENDLSINVNSIKKRLDIYQNMSKSIINFSLSKAIGAPFILIPYIIVQNCLKFNLLRLFFKSGIIHKIYMGGFSLCDGYYWEYMDLRFLINFYC